MTLNQNVMGRQEALQFYNEILKKKNRRDEMMIRDDYRELAECAMLVLGKHHQQERLCGKIPVACHKAILCAFGIYCLKALAFSNQLNLDDETVELLKQFCTFTATIYIPHFLASFV